MKRFTCLLFSIIFIVLSLNISKAEEQIQEEYYNVNVEFSDTRGRLESIQIMLKNNNVYINAEQIGTRLGYKISANDEYVAIYNKEKSDNVPYSMTLFYFNSTSIKHMIFNKMVDYQAVCESIKNDEGNWIPLEQALFLMNSSYMIEDSYILIDKPEKNITDIYMDILKENQNYKFDFTKDIGISEINLSKMEKASFLVQQLNGLLKNDGASWLQAFNNFGLDNSVYDKKYTEQFAMLFCTYSDDEFKKEIKDVNDKMSLFNGNSVMSKTIKSLNKQQTEKIDDLENELWKMISVSSSNTAKYNSTYKELEKICEQDKSLKKITALYNSVQDELKNVTEPFDKIMALAEVIEYLEEFVNQDEFAVEALSDFSSDAELSYNMSLAMKKELINYSDTLKSNIINYSAKRYLSENYSKLVSKGLKLSDALPGSATLMLIAWDIISDNVPYYKDGISQTDSFMLSVYSQIFMSDAFINYQKCRDSVFNSDSVINVSDLYKITEYCYTYLKSCYISRQSALGSLNKDTQNQIPDTIKYQEAINEEIAGYLVKLKNAKMSNEELDYGFLPENNKKFLDEYDNWDIIQLINNQKNNWKQIYVDFIKNYENPIGKNKSIQYTLAYINDDDIPELLMDFNPDYDKGAIAVIKNGEVKVLDLLTQNAYGLAYLERKGLIAHHYFRWMHHVVNIYRLSNNELKKIHWGEWYDKYERSNLETDSMLYFWDSEEVTKEEFNNKKNAEIDMSNVILAYNWYSKDSIISELNNYNYSHFAYTF